MDEKSFHYPLFVKGDIDGFIGLFIDNLVNLLLITGLCLSIGMPSALVFGKILPGAALSVLAGNLFYSWQARKLAIRETRTDVTALPYGINTVSLFAFFGFIIVPVYIQTKDINVAWRVGVASCFISGVFEALGAFVGERIRKLTPRAALLSTLAGIALAFIALNHTLPLWDKPLIAFIPLAFILIEYFSFVKLPFRIPAGLYALAAGAVAAWVTGSMDKNAIVKSAETVSFYLPGISVNEIITGFREMIPFVGISIPMGLIAFFATIQNLESAAAAGDNYPAMPALAMNGIGTIVGSFFGSPFPATVYIGHPGWKGMGARGGYSILNGAVMAVICLTGLMSVISAVIPLEAGYPILLWVGIIITAQAFQTTPASHAPAVALGLLPAIASWGISLLRQFINVEGKYSIEQMNSMISAAIPQMKGIIPFAEGPLLSAMFLTAVGVYLIEKDYLKAFWWTIPLIVCSYFGFIHASSIGINMSGRIPAGYGLFAAVILCVYMYNRFGNGDTGRA